MISKLNLQLLRNEVDLIDSEILKLLSKRWDLVLSIAQFKLDHGLGVFDPSRETEKLEELKKINKKKLPIELLENVFSQIMLSYRQQQYHIQPVNPSQAPIIGSVSIIGLGLMGGSFAKAIEEFLPNTKILAWDKNTSILPKKWAVSFDEVFQSEVVVLAMPTYENLNFLKKFSEKLGNTKLILNLSSTQFETHNWIKSRKELVNKHMSLHPLCGKSVGGYLNSDPTLFQNKTFLQSNNNLSPDLVSLTNQLIAAIGGQIRVVTAEDHDKYLASTSHLAQLLSTALMENSRKMFKDNLSQILTYVTPGFTDMTRLSSSPYNIWHDIIKSNSRNIIDNLNSISDIINQFKTLIQNKDFKSLEDIFESATQFKSQLNERNQGDSHDHNTQEGLSTKSIA